MRVLPLLLSGPMVLATLEGRKTMTRRLALDKHGRPSIWTKVEPGDVLYVRETWADVHSEEGPALLYRADSCVRSWHEWCVERGPDYGAGPSMNYDRYPGNYTMWWYDLLAGEPDHSWRSPLHMYRWASRITLVVTATRVEPLQDIPADDAMAEGIIQQNPTPDDWEWYRTWAETEGLDPLDPNGVRPVWLAPGTRQGWGDTKEKRDQPQWGPTPQYAFRCLWESLHGAGAWDDNPDVVAITFTVHRMNVDAYLQEAA